MNASRVEFRMWRFPLLAVVVAGIATSASAWDCPPDVGLSEVWYWCHDAVVDPSYAKTSLIGVAENQSTSLGTPAIAYVAKPSSMTLPQTFEVKVQLGSTVQTVWPYTSSSSGGVYSVISVPSISVLDSGEVYVAWVENKIKGTARSIRIVYRKRTASGEWDAAVPNQLFSLSLTHYRHGIGQFDVQMYDETHYAFGASWWTQASSTDPFTFNYRLKMMDGAHGLKDIIPVVNFGTRSYYDEEDYYPSLFGPVFSYKAGTASSAPSSVVFNMPTEYGEFSGSPLGEKLTIFAHVDADAAIDAEEVINNAPTPFFALATTRAGKRHVVYQHIGSPPTANWMYCATSDGSYSWSTHQPVASGPWSIEVNYGEPMAASADPTVDSDAFDVYCWTPGFYDPNIAWVLHHSGGTSYSVDDVVYDTSSILQRPEPKGIGTAGTSENVVKVYTYDNFHQLGINF